LLVSLPTNLPTGRYARFKAPVGADELTETVRRFRVNIEDRSVDSYLEQAQQLYGWLIRPLETPTRA